MVFTAEERRFLRLRGVILKSEKVANEIIS